MPQPSDPSSLADPSQGNPRLHPLVVLAWLMLVYTWLMGHYHWTLELPFPVWRSPHWGMLNHFGLEAFLKASSSHSLCLFKQWVGLPCIFCGMTRSFTLLSQGQWLASIHYHLLGIPFYWATLFLAVFGLMSPKKIQTALGLLSNKRALTLLIVVLLACWVWKLSQDPVFW